MKSRKTPTVGPERLPIAKVVENALKVSDAVDAALLQKLNFPPTPKRSAYAKHARALAARLR